jgi:hypothetical protein
MALEVDMRSLRHFKTHFKARVRRSHRWPYRALRWLGGWVHPGPAVVVVTSLLGIAYLLWH